MKSLNARGIEEHWFDMTPPSTLINVRPPFPFPVQILDSPRDVKGQIIHGIKKMQNVYLFTYNVFHIYDSLNAPIF